MILNIILYGKSSGGEFHDGKIGIAADGFWGNIVFVGIFCDIFNEQQRKIGGRERNIAVSRSACAVIISAVDIMFVFAALRIFGADRKTA